MDRSELWYRLRWPLAIVAVVAAVIALVVVLWPGGSDTKEATAPVTVTQTVSEHLDKIPTPTTAVSQPQASPTELVIRNLQTTVLPNTRTNGARDIEAKVGPCLDFTTIRYGMNPAQGYPGFAYRRLAPLTTGPLAKDVAQLTAEWSDPRGSKAFNAVVQRKEHWTVQPQHLWLRAQPGAHPVVVTVAYQLTGVGSAVATPGDPPRLVQCQMQRTAGGWKVATLAEDPQSY